MSETPKPKLLVINDNHFDTDGSGKVAFTASRFHEYLLALDKFEICLSSPYAGGSPRWEELTIDNVRVWPRPGWGRAIDFYKRAFRHLAAQRAFLERQMHWADIVMIVVPAQSLPVTISLLRKYRLPSLVYVVGDVAEVVYTGGGYTGMFRWLAKRGANFEWGLIRRVVKTRPTLILGAAVRRRLLDVAPHSELAMTSLVSRDRVRAPHSEFRKAPVTVLTACRLFADKGVEYGLQAVAKLNSEGHDIRYIIAGDGPHRKDLEQLAERIGISSIVTFLGWVKQDQLDAAAIEADIFLLPTMSEGVPKSVFEAMSSGLPVIATHVGGIPDQLGQNSERGWLIPCGSAQAIVNALKECISREDLRLDKMKAAHTYILDHTREAEAERLQAHLLQAHAQHKG